MHNLGRSGFWLLTAGVIIFAFAAPASAQVRGDPEVASQYKRYFVRYVDDRPVWQRALDRLDLDVGQTGKAFALIAGVSKYPNMSGRAANLEPARVDVEKIVAYLSSPPESFNEIVVLLDDAMTSENLDYFLTRYFPQRLNETPRSRFLFAYSGNGKTIGTGRSSRGYILTDEARDLQDRFGAGISLASLRTRFQEIVFDGHQVLALINACYGADFHRLSLAFGEERPRAPQREGAHAITAGGSNEVVWHDPAFGEGSIFFEAVLAALDGVADKLPRDGVVTVGELGTYLRDTISRFTDERQNTAVGDLYSTRSPGEFFFFDRRPLVEDGLVSDTIPPFDIDSWLSFGNNSEAKTVEEARVERGHAVGPTPRFASRDSKFFDQSPDQYLASTLMNMSVVNVAGDAFGDVNDMILMEDGRVLGVVIGVGGFLGIGEKNVLVEWSRLKVKPDQDGDLHFEFDMMENELKDAPEFLMPEDLQAEVGARGRSFSQTPDKFVFRQSPDQYLASALLEVPMRDVAGQIIGKVSDIVFAKDGQEHGIVVTMGGILGLHTKNVAVVGSLLNVTQDGNGDLHFRVDVTADELANATAFVTRKGATASQR